MEAARLAKGKKNAKRLGAHILFIDESGFLLIPPVRRTWAPRAQTPLCRHWQRHDRLSVISALSVSPKRRQLGLSFHLRHTNFNRAAVCEFLHELLCQHRGHVIVVWDNARIHQGRQLTTLCQRFPRLHLEPLPSYAPELNPDEHVWQQTKSRLANSRPDDIYQLRFMVFDLLCDLAVTQQSLRACIKRSGLSL